MKKDHFQQLRWWRFAQVTVWCIGCGIFLALLFRSDWGLHSFWDVLIPLAPAIIVIVPGVWRNVCPISSVSLISRHAGWSQKKRLSRKNQARLATAGLIILLFLIPLRHLFLNLNGIATAMLLFFLVAISFVFGLIYDWKSAWCAGMCPVHQVEKLYGSQGAKSFLNAHCGPCHNCSIPCPDSTLAPRSVPDQILSPLDRNTWILCGGFPGYIWGWFHTPDFIAPLSASQFGYTYLLPCAGFTVSLIMFWLLSQLLTGRSAQALFNSFAALSVSTYYWYRIPALVGYGVYPGDGMLLDLTGLLPSFVPTLIAFIVGVFFFWWFLFRNSPNQTWLIRPEYAKK